MVRADHIVGTSLPPVSSSVSDPVLQIHGSIFSFLPPYVRNKVVYTISIKTIANMVFQDDQSSPWCPLNLGFSSHDKKATNRIGSRLLHLINKLID